MRLKRGVERASCDFCHGRKIKCDRASRETQGHSSCSPCSLRQIQCLVDDSDDIRLRRRRRRSIHDENTAEQSTSQLLMRNPASGNVEDLNNSGINPGTFSKEVAPILREELEQPFSSYFPPTLQDNIPSSVDQTPDFSFVDTPFELSPESILFLDQIFMGGYEAPLGCPEPQIMMDGEIQPFVEGEQATRGNQDEPPAEGLAGNASQKPWIACNLDEETFHAALHAYFAFAAIHLPVIMENAFWQDYHAGRCSLALVYAVACRGIPFTATSDSWDKQQCLALKFREKFLEAQQISSGKTAIRLGDLEALALMVNWTYDETRSSALDSQLGSLFLTHESLVLATLQSQMQDCTAGKSGSSDLLACSEERRNLLFWHVYGLDAFHSLDQKLISRIPDGENSDISRKLLRHDAGSYLDAILNLAIIAREMLQALVTVNTKRNGVKPRDVEDCISHYGVKNEVPFEAETTALRVEFESLRAVHDGMEISQWMQQYSATTDLGTITESHFLIDLAPSIARDICAGLCFWICERGKTVLRHGSPSILNIHPKSRQREPKKEKDQRKKDVDEYMKTAKEFRSAVATATSHRDTKFVLERLDTQIASFEEALAQ
ncbi:hypothetical protein ACHAQJ_005280 [Trichoderma viride]